MIFPLWKFWTYSPHGFFAAVIWNASEIFGFRCPFGHPNCSDAHCDSLVALGYAKTWTTAGNFRCYRITSAGRTALQSAKVKP